MKDGKCLFMRRNGFVNETGCQSRYVAGLDLTPKWRLALWHSVCARAFCQLDPKRNKQADRKHGRAANAIGLSVILGLGRVPRHIESVSRFHSQNVAPHDNTSSIFHSELPDLPFHLQRGS